MSHVETTCGECGRTQRVDAGGGRCRGCGERLEPGAGAPARPTGRLIGKPSPRGSEPELDLAPPAPPRPTARLGVAPPTWEPPPVPRPSARVASPPARPAGVQRWAHWLLVLLLFPLAGSIITRPDDVPARWERTIEALDEPHRAALERLPESATLDDVFEQLPGERIDGALLARGSKAHWAFAAAAALGFLAVCLAFPRGGAAPAGLVGVAVFTATVGIALLLGFQLVADLTQGLWFKGRGWITLIFYVIKFIGFSYRAALDPENGFMASMVGFTCGVGLCEELCKALPLIWHYRSRATLDWRGALLWGLASGIGFGISEGVHYAGEFYNGSSGGGIYVVRFVSCVALHAVWSASVALVISRDPSRVQSHDEWWQTAASTVHVLLVPMVLHGLYDTLLKRDQSALALATAVASVAWLVWLAERELSEEDDAATVRA